MERSILERLFNVFNILVLLVLSLVMIYPMWHVLCASFSNDTLLMAHSGAVIKPVGWSIAAYTSVFSNALILRAYCNTLVIVLSTVALNMVLTITASYVVSRKDVSWVAFLTKLMVFTMFFSGGLIPNYLLVSKMLHLNNSYWALILPGAISAYNVIIMKASFESIPGSLIESCQIDGATHFRIIWQIVVPLSKAVICVILLYYTVSSWNAWFQANLYIHDRARYPLQLVLREILISNDTASMTKDVSSAADHVSFGETIKYAVIVVATGPILCIYPFVQKHFVAGVMLGSIKE